MDIAIAPRPKRARWIIGAVVGLSVLALTLVLARLKPAAPQAERSSLLIDSVKRGAMVFQVRGTGILVPVDVRMITAQVPCKVERILLYPGTSVSEDSIIAELSSPELQQAAEDALWQMRRAAADYEVDHLNQKATLNSAKANTQEANAVLLAAERLRKEGLQSDLDVLRARVKSEEVNGRMAAEEARMRLYENKAGQVGPARARLEQAKALYALKREQVASLKVRAGMAGILQQVPLQVGQQLMPGANLAKVAKPMPLKAELKVSETQAKDILIGQPVDVDTRNGIVQGKVIRIDPAVLNGTVAVDASMEGDLPKGVRPDLSVEGIVELDRATSALFTGRPVQAQSFGTLSVFKLNPEGTEATRIKVKLGRASVSTVEILEGLKEGDQIILSDTSQYDAVDR
ncbi:MAG: HlyD family efflux transporter periplasmic adaptor subunit, partial [Holophaga sp.]|nr:HlyD family efflux transporter periplasmic adaptor subunit [Holophaga sp.]